MSKIDQILENCLQAIDEGDAIETILIRYPDHADELRPILETAVSAKNKALFAVPADVAQRNRARLLQHAAEMRARRFRRRSSTIWFMALRRVVVTLTVLGIVFASGTSLVRASSLTVPGDNLYPFKRTWENMLVLITFNTEQREYLELEHENERLEEMQELFEQGRSAPVDFSGLITAQNADQWIVAGINVLISPQTSLPDRAVLPGAEVRIVGLAQNGFVQAQRIELLSANDAIPTLETSSSSNPGTSITPTPRIAVSSTAVAESTATNSAESSETNDVQSTSFKGIVQSMNGDIWTITGVKVDVSRAEISGVVAVGQVAKVEGYVDSSGVIIAQRIELPENISGSDNTSSNNSTSDSNAEHLSPTAAPGEHQEGGEHESEQHEPTETPEPEH